MMIFDFLDKKERDYSMASLMQAYRLGLIDNPRLAAVEQRRQVENRRRRESLEKGETVYGPEQYSTIAYLHHELTEFKLAYASESAAIGSREVFRPISREETRRFYETHKNLFTRYQGDAFSYEDVELIIRKKIREKEYEDAVQNILCQL